MFKSKFSLFKQYKNVTKIKTLQLIIKLSLIPINQYKKYLFPKFKILDLGCGEGLTSNLLSLLFPDISIIAIDKDKIINEAKKIKSGNIKYFQLNFLEDSFLKDKFFSDFDLIICNDVIHHLDYQFHRSLIEKLLLKLKPSGHLILKEVDKDDFIDYKMTKFFDARLYPNDKLSFRNNHEWKSLFNRIGFNKSEIIIKKCKHLWPASKTLYILKNKKFNILKIQSKNINEKNILYKKQGYTNILITGATGFIGRNLLEKFEISTKCHLTLLLRKEKQLPSKHNLSYHYVELSELEENSEIFSNIDYVIHLASEVKYENGENIYENNILSTKKLLRSIGHNKKKIKKLIFASTIGVIDRHPNDNCDNPLSLNDKPYPTSYYGYSKLISERFIEKFNINYINLRICWAYGKFMSSDTHIKFFFDCACKNKFFTFFDFPGKFSLIHVNDLIKIIEIMLTNKLKDKTYFINNGHPVSFGEIFREFKKNKKYNFFIKIPKFLVKFFKKKHFWLPFKIKVILFNALVTDNHFYKEIKFNSNKFPYRIKDLND